MKTSSLLLIAGLVGLLQGAPVHAAEPSPAQALFEQGIKDMLAGRFDEACPPIEQSYKIEPLPGTLFYLAECEAKRGRIATALARYNEYLVLYPKLPRDKKAKQGNRLQTAKKQVAALEPQVPRLTLVPPADAPASLIVQCDGVPVDRDALGTPLPVDPGEHVVTTWLAGDALSQLQVKLAAGEKLSVRLTYGNQAAAPPPRSPGSVPANPPDADTGYAQGPSPARRAVTYVAGGVGLVGLVIGGLMGGFAIAQKSAINAGCKPTGDADKLVCNDEGYRASENLREFGLWSTVGVGVGAAASGVALVLITTEPSGPKPAARGNGWMTAGVVSLGLSGAVLGVSGAW